MTIRVPTIPASSANDPEIQPEPNTRSSRGASSSDRTLRTNFIEPPTRNDWAIRAYFVPAESKYALTFLCLVHVLVGEPASTSPEHALERITDRKWPAVEDQRPSAARRWSQSSLPIR